MPEDEQLTAQAPVSESEQLKLLAVLAEANLQLQAGWLPRMRALKQLRALLTEPGEFTCSRLLVPSARPSQAYFPSLGFSRPAGCGCWRSGAHVRLLSLTDMIGFWI